MIFNMCKTRNWVNPTRVVCFLCVFLYCIVNRRKKKIALTGVGRATLEHPAEPMGTGGVLVLATPHVCPPYRSQFMVAEKALQELAILCLLYCYILYVVKRLINTRQFALEKGLLVHSPMTKYP